MRIAKEGNIFIYPLILITIALFVLFSIGYISIYLILASFLLLIFCLNFFRDPLRVPPLGKKLIIAPADGKIIKIDKIFDKDIGEANIISIFLNIFDVHVNRMPLNGKVLDICYKKGSFIMAFDHKACDENERNIIKVETNFGKLKIIQIAGLLARRIVCYAKVGESMEIGSRLGFMRFGSRIDLIIPINIKLKIELGQKVMGNKTIIATF